MSEELALGEVQVAERYARLVAKSVDVVAVADDTYKIPRDPETGGLKRPPEMEDAEWNIHCDAMKSSRNAPLYMQQHYERVATDQKLKGLKGGELPPSAGLIGVLVRHERYPVIDVSATEVK